MLLMHGAADKTVLPKNSRNLAARVNEVGGSAELEIYPETSHIGLIAPLVAPLRGTGSELDDFAAFINKVASDSLR